MLAPPAGVLDRRSAIRAPAGMTANRGAVHVVSPLGTVHDSPAAPSIHRSNVRDPPLDAVVNRTVNCRATVPTAGASIDTADAASAVPAASVRPTTGAKRLPDPLAGGSATRDIMAFAASEPGAPAGPIAPWAPPGPRRPRTPRGP